MLAHRADRRTLLYMAAATALPLLQWTGERFQPLLFAASLVAAFAVGVMHHNHQHTPLWRAAWLNRLTDYWFTLFQGHPGFAFGPSHLGNHHVHRNGPADHTRTWRGRDDNSLLGLAAHPVLFAWRIAPVLQAHLAALWRGQRPAFWRAMRHYAVLAAAIGAALAADPARAVLFVLLPQAVALFFLLLSNYLQHAHADGGSAWNHSRNFLGLVNPLFFNVGYHTAHHLDGNLHWSALPELHRRIAPRIDPRLVEPGLGTYCLRVFVLGILVPRWRSASLMERRPH